jgi:hypothetical protein
MSEKSVGTDHGASTRMATRLGVTPQRWSNSTHGSPLGLKTALIIVRRCPGVTLDWLYHGNAGGLTLQMAKLLLDEE